MFLQAKHVLLGTTLQKYSAPSQLESQKATRTCKARMALCYTTYTHPPRQEPGKTPGIQDYFLHL